MALSILLALAIAAPQGAVHYSKRALLVGAWDYRSARWGDLSSKKDVERIAQLLKSRFQWTADHGGNILILTRRDETTRKGIIGAFKSFLAADVRAGDTIYFHSSGHGYYTPDVDPKKYPNVAKWAPVNPVIGNGKNGLDTTLVPTDDPDHDANQIRSDELAQLIQEIKTAAKGKRVNILITLDCCHSGQGTRGAGVVVRGRNYDGPIYPWAAKPGPVPGGYTAIEACASDQEAADEVGKGGRFTLALCAGLVKSTATTSYRELKVMIDGYMATYFNMGAVGSDGQNPQMEGDADQQVLGATAIPEPRYYLVRPDGAGGYLMVAGALQMIGPGASVDLYPADMDPESPGAKRFAQATVGDVSLEDARLTFSEKPTAAQMEGAKALIRSSQGYSNVLTVNVSAIQDRADYPAIARSLADLKTVSIVAAEGAKADLAIIDYSPTVRTLAIDGTRGVRPAPDGQFHVMRLHPWMEIRRYDEQTGSPLTIPAGDQAPAKLVEALKQETMREAFFRLDNDLPSQADYVEIRIRPCEATPQGNGYVFKRFLPEAADGVLPIGSFFVVQYRVHGEWNGSDPYLALIDLTSDKASLLWPRAVSSQAVPRAGGDWRFLQVGANAAVYQVGEPLGGETIKAVATLRQIPFRDLFGAKGRGPTSPLGVLIDDFAQNRSRSKDVSPDPGEPWSTRTTTITVVKATPKGS